MLARLTRPLSPAAYRRVTMAALALLVAIVVTGAGVRLTGSGLGCTDWPRCTEKTFTPSSDIHAKVEFYNRMVTGLVSLAVAAAVLGSLRRAPRRRDLTWLSLGLVGGVIGQIVLGGLVVLTHLNPWLVQGHFVVSMVLVANAVVLTHRAGIPDGAEVRPIVTPALLAWGRALLGLATVVLLTGTLVTGSGPHSGHNEAEEGASALEAAREVRRLPIAVHDAARIHGIAMMAFLAATIWVLVQLRRHQPDGTLVRRGTALLTVLILQGAIGYTQYFTGVPPALVALHILGASLVWVAVLVLVLHLRAPIDAGTASPADPPLAATVVDPTLVADPSPVAASGDGAGHPDPRSDGDLVSRG
ncbi:MAG: heme A synthase [Acidimicrobiales bacterium]|nr:heme A synthase [Acidimicrobiales bacterium]